MASIPSYAVLGFHYTLADDPSCLADPAFFTAIQHQAVTLNPCQNSNDEALLLLVNHWLSRLDLLCQYEENVGSLGHHPTQFARLRKLCIQLRENIRIDKLLGHLIDSDTGVQCARNTICSLWKGDFGPFITKVLMDLKSPQDTTFQFTYGTTSKFLIIPGHTLKLKNLWAREEGYAQRTLDIVQACEQILGTDDFNKVVQENDSVYDSGKDYKVSTANAKLMAKFIDYQRDAGSIPKRKRTHFSSTYFSELFAGTVVPHQPSKIEQQGQTPHESFWEKHMRIISFEDDSEWLVDENF